MFESIGRGVFIALMVIALPGLIVVLFYDEIDAWSKGISGMPVFHTLKKDFQTGTELVGTTFAAHLKTFYSDSLPEINEDAELTTEQRTIEDFHPDNLKQFWGRNAVEQDLTAHLASKHRPNAKAYLDYVDQHREAALAEMQRYKIPASVTLAQGLLETNAGRAFLARKANNHFGIKCRTRPGFRNGGIRSDDFYPHSLATDCVQLHDDYAWDRFEVYPSARESFRRHSLLLSEKRYRWMLSAYPIGGIYTIPRKLYGQTSVPYYAAWCVGLKSSGYATAPNYAETLTLIIETYQLWKIDYEMLTRDI